MKLQAISALLSIAVVSASQGNHARHAHLVKRQAAATLAASGSASAAASSGTAAAGSASGTGAAATGTQAGGAAPTNLLDATASIPLSSITSGMQSQATLAPTTTYAAGATPPVSGAPALPTPFKFVQGQWPAQDVPPPTDSDEVKQWMKELEGFDIPDLSVTVEDAMCDSNPDAKAQAEQRGWWSCAPGLTRDTDITSCPDKMTWGVSFDDGPSPYTPTILKYLDEKDIKATFFVVGSRVIERPDILVDEYMSGHEISVHTWSHRHLTTLTNEQIVAELGWTRKAIQAVLGVTPTTMRPPYGDMDDRVRGIALAMGLVPIIWTRTPSGAQMDTNDWKVAGGLVTGVDSFNAFNDILGNASVMDTGFIVLQHDLYQITVDLAVDYTLNAALTHQPPFTLKAIGDCAGIPASNLYRESNTNTTFPASKSGSDTVDVDGDGTAETGNNAQSNPGSGGSGGTGAAMSDFAGSRITAILCVSLTAMLGSVLV